MVFIEMNQLTKFENLSNEILIEIFDFFHAIDLFVAFGSLNKRISSILRSIHLCVIVTPKHNLWHIKFLSNNLNIHVNQVISLSINDDTEDRLSAIDFLFQRHRFKNVRSCIFQISSSFPQLTNFIEQLESMKNLQSIYINQSHLLLSQLNKQHSSCSILGRVRSTALRSVALLHHYNHCEVLNNDNLATSKVTYLQLMIHISFDNELTCSLMHTLRFCPKLRRLRLIVRNGSLVKRYSVT